LRSFALGELGWSLERFLNASLYEFNEASKGYWRNRERDSSLVRDIIFTLITGNPYIEKQNKPNKPSDLYKLSIDKEVKEEKQKATKVTAQDLKVYEALSFGIKK
jgi:hypothetical protein